MRTNRSLAALLALSVLCTCTTPPLETRPTSSPYFTAIATAPAVVWTAGVAPVARIEGSASTAVAAVAVDGDALSVLFDGSDQNRHLARVFPPGDVQDLDLQMQLSSFSSPWGPGLFVGSDGSRWIGSYRSVLRVRPDRTFEEVPIASSGSRPPGFAAEAGRNGEVSAIFADGAVLYLGRAGIPALTRVDLTSGRAVAFALPPDMPDVGTIAQGAAGDLFLAANHRATRFAPEPTARLRRGTERIEALPYRGRPLRANGAWLAIATPDARLLDASLTEARAPIPSAQFDLAAFDLLGNGEFVTVDPNDAVLLFYDLSGRVTRRVPFQARVVAGGLERPPHFVVADGAAVWLVWGLDVFHVS
jgi:hypothetical protein